MSTGFKPVEIPPGVVATATKKQRSSNWAEVNLVRWRESQLQPMGGQAKLSNIVGGTEMYQFASRCKLIHGWFGLDGVYRIAYLCELHLYVDVGGTLYDISPTVPIAPPTGLVGGFGDGVYSRNILLNAASGWVAGATTIQMPAGPGAVLPGMQVYDMTKAAAEGDKTKIVGVVASYSGTTLTLTSGALIAGSAGDVLDFDWYGKQRVIPTSVAITKVPDAYSLDNFGSILYAMTSGDNRLLRWDPAAGAPGPSNLAAEQVADVGRGPVPKGRCFVVTQERFIQIFGTAQDGTAEGGKPSRFAWCDQENPGAWDYTNVVSQAGFFDIEPASPIVTANSSRTGTLIWTAKKAYSSRFLGAPYIYNCVELADGTTPWSSQSVATTSSMILWMTEQGPYSYDGTNILPVKCMIRPWVDDDFDPIAVRQLSFAMHLSEFSEWWWFFPTLNSLFNTKAIVYNYNEGWWTQVRLSRSAGMTSSYTSHPIMADDYFAIQHEVFQATSYVNISMPATLPFAETFDLNLGDKLMSVKQLIPDVEAMDPVDTNAAIQAISNLRYSLFYRNSRSLGTPELQSVPQSVRPDGYVDLRTTGRDIRLRIDMGSSTVLPFTLGQHLIDAVARGDR